MTMTAESPALLASSLEHAQKKQAMLTEFIARRLGVDPAADLRPHVIAAAATCGFQAAADATRNHGDAFGTLSETVDKTFAILESGLNVPAPEDG